MYKIKKTLKNFSLILFFTIQFLYCKTNPEKLGLYIIHKKIVLI